jgi:uncharacterized protein (DUF2062 family)
VSAFWRKTRRFLAVKVLHTGDTPHAIARGAAIATFVAFLPLVGLQTVIAIGLAALARANKAICVPIVWITNPFTLWPIYGACYALGRVLLARPAAVDEAAVLSELQRQQAVGFFELAYWKNVFTHLGRLGLELWVGCIIVGFVGALVAYGLSHWGVTAYRERRRKKLLRRSLFRSQATIARGVRPGTPD